MYDSVSQAFMGFSTTFEGRVNWMYVDIKNLVTTGIGNLIDPVGLAQAVKGWVHNDDMTTPASPDEIDADWHAVKDAQANGNDLAMKGYQAARAVTNLWLPDSAVDALVLAKVKTFEGTLKQTPEFAGFDAWPADAQLALLSMSWAMGPAFGRSWPKFKAFCAAADWTGAAGECHIPDAANPGLRPRNVADRTLFENAAYGVAQGSSLDQLLYQSSGSRSAIGPNSTGADVSYLQQRLVALGYSVTDTGTYDPDTIAAVQQFQTDHGLSADGRVGSISWAALGSGVPSGTATQSTSTQSTSTGTTSTDPATPTPTTDGTTSMDTATSPPPDTTTDDVSPASAAEPASVV